MKLSNIQASTLVLLSGVSSVIAVPSSPGLSRLDRPAYDSCVEYAPKFNELVPKPSRLLRRQSGTKETQFKKKMDALPAANGSLQCRGTSSTVPSGKQLADAIDKACKEIINTGTGNKWLELGDLYTATAQVDGKLVQFGLQPRVGGLTVSRDLCTGQLSRVMGCAGSRGGGKMPTGGCSWTSDNNLQSCIFISDS